MAKAPSAVLSARVPTEIIREIDRICKKQGISRSQWLTATLAKDKSNEVMKMSKGGKLQLQAYTMPVDIQNMLAGLGLLTAGITLYSITKDVLTNARDESGRPKFTQGQVDAISVSTLMVLALVGAGVFNTILNEA
jgi:uncharacterized Zn finger protein